MHDIEEMFYEEGNIIAGLKFGCCYRRQNILSGCHESEGK
jgi:hypothetical protein